MTLPARKYRSWNEQVRRGKIIRVLIGVGIVGVLALFVYYGIKDILEADINVHLAAFMTIVGGSGWALLMALVRFFFKRSKYRKYWYLGDIGKPDP